MFIAAALFIITKKLKQPNCQSTDPWITRNLVYPYNRKLCVCWDRKKEKEKERDKMFSTDESWY